jgi:hypothetical protein
MVVLLILSLSNGTFHLSRCSLNRAESVS